MEGITEMFKLSAITKNNGITKYAHGIKVNVLDSDRDHPFGERVSGELFGREFSGLLEYHGRKYIQVEVIEPGVYQSYIGQTPIDVPNGHQPGQVLNYRLENITVLEEEHD